MIRNRNDLMDYLAENASQPCIKRAVESGRVENLGLFLPPGGIANIVAKMTSKHGKVWHVAIIMSYKIRKPKVHLMCEPLWKDWGGDVENSSLFQGDHSEKYKELRDAAQNENLH